MQDAITFDDEETDLHDGEGDYNGPGTERAVRPQLVVSLVVTIIITAATGLTLMTLISGMPVSRHRLEAGPHRFAAIQDQPSVMPGGGFAA
jgi:hypothetical protein